MVESIKSVTTPRYRLDLFQDEAGSYHIRYENLSAETIEYGSYKDYSLAAYVFDMKLNNLEGN